MSLRDREFLSICIPTRNRSKYLNALLGMISGQLGETERADGTVRVYVSDNASEDDTPVVAAAYKEKLPGMSYSCNERNIGADGNNLHVRGLARGEYIWAMGDDEILSQDALPNVLESLRQHRCGLLIAFNTEYRLGLTVPALFDDYREFVRACVKGNPHALAEHSLISCNIYRADCFDAEYARRQIATNYPHMYGMIRPLQKVKASVFVPAYPVITIRETYPYPMEIEGRWIDIDRSWTQYFGWMREELGAPELDPSAPSRGATAIMRRKILRHPLRYIWNNRRVWFKPSAYWFFLRRLVR